MKWILIFLSLFLIGCGGSKSASVNETFLKFLPFYPVGSDVNYSKPSIYSFIISKGGCNPGWDWDLSADLEDYKTVVLKDGGVSFGGAGAEGRSLAFNCSEDDLFNAYEKVLSVYNVHWLDFDVEGGMLSEKNANENRFKVLKRLKAKYPDLRISFTLPVMPYGFDDEVKDFIKEAKKYIDFKINLMLMDYGSEYKADDKNKTLMFDYSKEAVLNAYEFLKTYGFSFSDIGAVAMIGVNDVKDEVWYRNDFALLKDFVLKNNLYLLSFWSINRDKPGSDIQTSTGLDKKDYGMLDFEYARIGELADFGFVSFLDENDTLSFDVSVDADIYDVNLSEVKNVKKGIVICKITSFDEISKAKKLGCEGVDVKVDDINEAIKYAVEAKKEHLLIAQDGGIELTDELASYFDLLIVSNAIKNNQTSYFLPYILQKKPVYDVEYEDVGCEGVNNFHLILYNKPIKCKD